MYGLGRGRLRFAVTLLLLLWAQSLGVQASEIETSVVRLDLNNVKYSESFEIYDTGETILLPMVALGSLLDAQVSLDVVNWSAMVVRSWDGETGVIDVKSQVLNWGEKVVPLDPPALVGSGDFYVPISAFELLMDARVQWVTETQTLSVNVNRTLKVLKHQAEDAQGRSDITNAQTEKPANHIPLLSLGSVQYVLIHQRSSDVIKHLDRDEVSLGIHLQAGGIPIDIYGKGLNLLSATPVWQLDQATATYLAPSLQAVVGDTTINVGKVLQNKNIRGFSVAAPPGWTSNVLQAVTTIAGDVTADSEVSLTINDIYFGKVIAEDGHYSFTGVPLLISKTNKITVTVIEPDGTHKVEIRYLAASPRLLKQGDLQVSAGAGWVKEDDDVQWKTAVLGSALYSGVTSWLTVGGEIAQQMVLGTDNTIDGPSNRAGLVGLALRAADNLVFSLDWLVSKTDGSPTTSQGWEATANWQLGNIAWQSVVFYRQPSLRFFSPLETDIQGYKIIAEYDVNKKWNLQGSLQQAKPVSTPDTDPNTIMSVTSRWNPSQDSSILLGLERNANHSDRVTLVHSYEDKSKSNKLRFEANGRWVEEKGMTPSLTVASAKVEVRREFASNAFFGASFNGVAERSVLGTNIFTPFLRRNTTEADITWAPGLTYIRAAAGVDDVRRLSGDTIPQGGEKYSLAVSRILGPLVVGLSSEFAVNRQANNREEYLTNSVSLGINTKFGLSSQIRLDDRHPTPVADQAERVKVTLKSGLTLQNGLYLGLTGKVESSFNAGRFSEPDYFIGVSLSQGLGFSNGGVRGLFAASGRPMSYVEGVVYIDANENGKRDRGEKPLAGIPVKLAGRRTKTDSNGRYCFDFVNTGIYRLGLDQEGLSADYTPVTDSLVIKVSPNANLKQDFGVTLNGTIEGTVFVDLNNDGTYQADEPVIPWVKVVLDGNKECYTDNRGNFAFGNVNIGEHTVKIASSPPGTLPSGDVVVEIFEEKLDVWGIMMPLMLQ